MSDPPPDPPGLPDSPDPNAALEAEHQRLAAQLEHQVIAPLSLLLSQAHAYEVTLADNPQARLVASVLSSLAQRVVQQVRDLEADLYPQLLERLGLEAALEAYAGQIARAAGVLVELRLTRLPEPLPYPLALALYRLAQAATERAIHTAGATRLTITLDRVSESPATEIVFRLTDNGRRTPGEALTEALQAALARVEALGGRVQIGRGAEGRLVVAVWLALHPAADLTAREQDVLRLLAQGRTNRQIGAALAISHRTVNFHLDNLYSKLGVNSRTEAVLEALRRGWIDPG